MSVNQKRRLAKMTKDTLAIYPDAFKYDQGLLGIGLCNCGVKSVRGPNSGAVHCKKCGVLLCRDCIDGLKDECVACYENWTGEDVRERLTMAEKRGKCLGCDGTHCGKED